MNQRKATIRPDVLEGMETSEIIDHILQHVVKSNEELQEEKSEMRKKSTDLKMFVLKKRNLESDPLRPLWKSWQLRRVHTKIQLNS